MAEADTETHQEFTDAVNMSEAKLIRWLDTDESKSVGMKATSPAG